MKDEIGGVQILNEEFQKIVLEELRSLKEGQREIKKELEAITEQTADLTEFREETNATYF